MIFLIPRNSWQFYSQLNFFGGWGKWLILKLAYVNCAHCLGRDGVLVVLVLMTAKVFPATNIKNLKHISDKSLKFFCNKNINAPTIRQGIFVVGGVGAGHFQNPHKMSICLLEYVDRPGMTEQDAMSVIRIRELSCSR